MQRGVWGIRSFIRTSPYCNDLARRPRACVRVVLVGWAQVERNMWQRETYSCKRVPLFVRVVDSPD